MRIAGGVQFAPNTTPTLVRSGVCAKMYARNQGIGAMITVATPPGWSQKYTMGISIPAENTVKNESISKMIIQYPILARLLYINKVPPCGTFLVNILPNPPTKSSSGLLQRVGSEWYLRDQPTTLNIVLQYIFDFLESWNREYALAITDQSVFLRRSSSKTTILKGTQYSFSTNGAPSAFIVTKVATFDTFCHFCGACGENLKKCPDCSVAWFCSESCRLGRPDHPKVKNGLIKPLMRHECARVPSIYVLKVSSSPHTDVNTVLCSRKTCTESAQITCSKTCSVGYCSIKCQNDTKSTHQKFCTQHAENSILSVLQVTMRLKSLEEYTKRKRRNRKMRGQSLKHDVAYSVKECFICLLGEEDVELDSVPCTEKHPEYVCNSCWGSYVKMSKGQSVCPICRKPITDM